MDEEFLIELVFKDENGKPELRLRPQETQLLLAHIVELILDIMSQEDNAA